MQTRGKKLERAGSGETKGTNACVRQVRHLKELEEPNKAGVESKVYGLMGDK